MWRARRVQPAVACRARPFSTERAALRVGHLATNVQVTTFIASLIVERGLVEYLIVTLHQQASLLSALLWPFESLPSFRSAFTHGLRNFFTYFIQFRLHCTDSDFLFLFCCFFSVFCCFLFIYLYPCHDSADSVQLFHPPHLPPSSCHRCRNGNSLRPVGRTHDLSVAYFVTFGLGVSPAMLARVARAGGFFATAKLHPVSQPPHPHAYAAARSLTPPPFRAYSQSVPLSPPRHSPSSA